MSETFRRSIKIFRIDDEFIIDKLDMTVQEYNSIINGENNIDSRVFIDFCELVGISINDILRTFLQKKLETYISLNCYIEDYCYSKAKIARKLNRSPQWLSNVLKGKSNLKVEDFKKICEAIGADCKTVDSYRREENVNQRVNSKN